MTSRSDVADTRQRLDTVLVERGLADTRTRAQALILAGQVRVDDQTVTKAGTRVRDDAAVVLAAPDHPYVGRGGVKLTHALETFAVELSGRHTLDIGASTGGFTDAMLQRGAGHVVAVDVGRGQLAWSLRDDPRVTVLEGLNARYLTPDQLPATYRRFSVVTIDVSFISLRLILPVVPPLLEADGDVIALVKPQFEAGRSEVGKGGIIRDAAVHARVVDEVATTADTLGLTEVSRTPSPILGVEGNQEFLLHFRHHASA